MEARSLERLAAVFDPELFLFEGTLQNVGWADYRDNHIGPEMKEVVPVPIDPNRFRQDVSMERGLLLAAAAGPMANLVLAMASALPLRLAPEGSLPPAAEFLPSRSVAINRALAVFNLLPIPPLEGSRIADALIPFSWRGAWNRVSGAGVLILVGLFVVPRFFGLPIGDWLTNFSSRLMGR